MKLSLFVYFTLIHNIVAIPTPGPSPSRSSKSLRLQLSRDTSAFNSKSDQHEPGNSISKRVSSGKTPIGRAPYGATWLAPVVIGGQEVSITIDTGSANLWVRTQSTTTDDANSELSKASYDPLKSNTLQYQRGVNFAQYYADNTFNMTGKVATESVAVGAANVTMPIGIASHINFGTWGSEFYNGTDGTLGLAFSYLDHGVDPPRRVENFLAYLKPYVDQFVFTTAFTRTGGILEIGKVDKTLYTGDFADITISNTTADFGGTWLALDVSFSIGKAPVAMDPIAMSFDTGTASMYIPEKLHDAYFAQVPGSKRIANYYEFPCNYSKSLPSMELSFANKNRSPSVVSIPGEAIYGGTFGNNSCWSWLLDVDPRASHEIGTVGSIGTPLWISKFVVWNQSSTSISIADQAFAKYGDVTKF